MPNIESIENKNEIIKDYPIIGLFGTCGGSKWRDKFIEKYDEQGIYYFNPNKENWNRNDAKIEAEHLKEDEIILFPVTGETYGTGSLSEVGFSIMQAIDQNRGAKIVVMIESDLDESLNDPIARKESIRSRSIILEHLNKIQAKNVYVVDDLETMLDISIGLHHICKAEKKLHNHIEQQRNKSTEPSTEQKQSDNHDDQDDM